MTQVNILKVTCDRCHKIDEVPHPHRVNIGSVAQPTLIDCTPIKPRDGWVKVTEEKDLCPDCAAKFSDFMKEIPF